MTQNFAQISDPHLTTLAGVRARDLFNKRALGYLSWRRKRRHEHRPEVLDALCRDLRGQDFQQILVTGDLTHIGLPMEFEQARNWLRQLGEPTDVALVPGNHDSCVASPWENTYALWEDYMSSDSNNERQAGSACIFPSLRQRGDIVFIGLSTACPTAPLMATGSIDEAQLRQLPNLLDRAYQQGLCRVVYLHHSPVPGVEQWRKRLCNAPALSRILEDHGAELVLHGHGHRRRNDSLQTRHGLAPVIAIPSASAMGLHGKDSAAYNRYSLQRQSDGWDLQVSCRRYDVADARFIEGDRISLELKRPGLQPSPENL